MSLPLDVAAFDADLKRMIIQPDPFDLRDLYDKWAAPLPPVDRLTRIREISERIHDVLYAWAQKP